MVSCSSLPKYRLHWSSQGSENRFGIPDDPVDFTLFLNLDLPEIPAGKKSRAALMRRGVHLAASARCPRPSFGEPGKKAFGLECHPGAGKDIQARFMNAGGIRMIQQFQGELHVPL